MRSGGSFGASPLRQEIGLGAAVLNCAKAGSPLMILADDGTIYLPISSEIPATGQDERLMRFAGEKVVVSGEAFHRGGSHALVIATIETSADSR